MCRQKLVSHMKGMMVALTIASCSFPAAAYDVTAFLRARSGGIGNIVAELGANTLIGAETATGAVDGNLTTDAGRVLLKRGNSGYILTPNIILTPVAACWLTEFTIYRLVGANNVARTTREFALDGSNDGGVTWTTLYETTEKLDWSSDTSKKFAILAENQAEYAKYRFRLIVDLSDTEVDATYVGFQEIAMEGAITGVDTLEWSAFAGGQWDATTANWLSFAGIDSAWVENDVAHFGTNGINEIVVLGNKHVDGIVFSGSEAHALSGDSIVLTGSGRIVAGDGDVISCDLTNDVMEKVDAHSGWLPALGTASDAQKKLGQRILLWRNCRLADITGMAGTLYYNGARNASGYCFKNDGRMATVLFQFLSGANNICVKVKFDQDGNNVWAQVMYARYKKDAALGTDFDAITGASGVYVYDNNKTTTGYGIKDIAPVFRERMPPELAVDFTRTNKQDEWGSYLPQSDNKANVGKNVICWQNRRLSDLAGIASARLCYSGSARNTEVCYFTNDGETASVQLQGFTSDDPSAANRARICVKVEFTQSGADILGRIVYLKYDRDNLAVHDFDLVVTPGGLSVYDDNHTDGSYGVQTIVGSFKGQLALNGAFNVTGDVKVGDGTLVFGGSALALNRDFNGSGTLRFSPTGSSQTVTVSGARTIPRLELGGTVTLAFESGSSLQISQAVPIADTIVTLPSPVPDHALRIGTTKCLTRSQIRQIFGLAPVSQDSEGWITPSSGMILTFK